MTPEAQQIAMAEAHGWDYDPEEAHEWGSRGQWVRQPEKKHERRRLFSKSCIPDYLNDLNAMHEAEKVLNEKQLYCYGNKLDDLTRREEVMEMSYVNGPKAGMYPELFRATAAQRAEAFLRTIGKWEEITE